MRLLLASLAFCWLAACSGESGADKAPAPAVDEGGVVRQEGMLGMYRCVKPFADAGKACRSKSDCEGKCLATDDAMPDADVTGACQADDSPFGCYAEVEGGKIQTAICVD